MFKNIKEGKKTHPRPPRQCVFDQLWKKAFDESPKQMIDDVFGDFQLPKLPTFEFPSLKMTLFHPAPAKPVEPYNGSLFFPWEVQHHQKHVPTFEQWVPHPHINFNYAHTMMRPFNDLHLF